MTETLHADVCVVGAGASGLGAAIVAARLGAEVVLVERDRWLGGTSTNAGVCVWQPSVCQEPLCRELYARAEARGVGQIGRAMCLPGAEMPVKLRDPAAVYEYAYMRCIPWTREFANGLVITFTPDGYDAVAREMLAETGHCRVLDDTAFAGLEMHGGRVVAISAASEDVAWRVECGHVVDCTGDVVVAQAAGVETRCGEDPRSLHDEPSAPEVAGPRLNGVTLMYAVAKREGLTRPADCEAYADGVVHGSADVCELPGGDLLVNNVFMMTGDDALAMGLERAYEELSRRIWLCWDLTRPRFGLQDYRIVWVAPQLGIREGPRIVGRYVMTEHDILAGARAGLHDDIISMGSQAMDTHGPHGGCVEAPHGPWGVPLRCLRTREVENLWVACRGASFSHLAASAVRLQRTMMELGAAAARAIVDGQCAMRNAE